MLTIQERIRGELSFLVWISTLWWSTPVLTTTTGNGAHLMLETQTATDSNTILTWFHLLKMPDGQINT
jgi:hypothetical protein